MKQFIKQNFILILSLIYILSPFDFIPEALLGPLGIIDDASIVVFLIIRSIYLGFKERRSNE